MKRIATLFLASIMVLSATMLGWPAAVNKAAAISSEYLQTVNNSYNCVESSVVYNLGCNSNAILSNDSSVAYEGYKYYFKDGALLRSRNDDCCCILKCNGRNLNISKGKLYYSVFDGNASICSFDLEKGITSTILKVGSNDIVNLYVVDDSYVLFLVDGRVQRLDLGSGDLSEIETPDQIISFIPTRIGNLYATGSAVSSTLYIDCTKLIDNVTYYAVEGDNIIVVSNGQSYYAGLFQMSFLKENTGTNEPANSAFLNLAEPYEYYGTYDIGDILSFDGSECEKCSAAFNSDYSTEMITRDDNTDYSILNTTDTAITPNSFQQAIINRAAPVVNLTWYPEYTFDKYRSSTGYLVSNDYRYHETSYGLPYSIGDKYDTEGIYNQVFIGFDRFDGETNKSTLAGFLNRVSDSDEDVFYDAAKAHRYYGYGALYGLDCSSYVCYAWNYTARHGSGVFSSDGKCTQLTNIGTNGSVTNTDLQMLLPGDAFISAGNHAILVTAVYKNSSGVVTRVETMEETPPSAVKTTYGGSGADHQLSYLLTEKLDPSSSGWPYQIYRLRESVIFKPNGGIVYPKSIQIVVGKTYGQYNNLALPTPTRSGFGFTGWYTAASGGTWVTASTMVTSTSARILYAHWQPNSKEIIRNRNPF